LNNIKINLSPQLSESRCKRQILFN
jgi:hypothetical protein